MKIPVMLSKKKVIACVLSVMMLCGMSAFAYAEDGTAQAEKTAVTQEGVVDDDVQLMEENEAEASKDAELKEETSEQKVSEQETSGQTASEQKEVASATNEKENQVVGKVTAQSFAQPVEVKLSGKVTLDNGDVKKDDYMLILHDVTDESKEDKLINNGDDGTFSFTLTYNEELPSHKYTISQKKETDLKYIAIPTVDYDSTIHHITITVNEDRTVSVYDEDNKKPISKINDQNEFGPFNFKNKVKTQSNTNSNTNTNASTTVTPATYQFKVKVNLTGRTLVKDQYTYTLRETTSGVASADRKTLTAKNDASGNVTFDAITYDKEGEYTYTITQGNSTVSGLNNDNTTYNATVTVTKASDGKLSAALTKLTKGNSTTDVKSSGLVFNNSAPTTTTTTTNTTDANKGPTNTAKGPTTGDSSEIGLFTGLLVGFVIVLIGTLFSFRRRKSSRK